MLPIPRCRAALCRSGRRTRSASARARASAAGTSRSRSGSPASRAIGNSAPARKNGRIATTGVAPMYSSCLAIRLASVSASAVHEHREQQRGAGEPRRRRARSMWNDAAAQRRQPDQRRSPGARTAPARRRGCPSTRYARGTGAASSSRWAPLCAVDDHAEPGEDAAERDDEADRADADERLVVDVGVQAAGRDLQRGRDDHRQHRRAEQRHEDLARVARGQRGAAPRERQQRARRCARATRGGRESIASGSAIADIGCSLSMVGQAASLSERR